MTRRDPYDDATPAQLDAYELECAYRDGRVTPEEVEQIVLKAWGCEDSAYDYRLRAEAGLSAEDVQTLIALEMDALHPRDLTWQRVGALDALREEW